MIEMVDCIFRSFYRIALNQPNCPLNMLANTIYHFISLDVVRIKIYTGYKQYECDPNVLFVCISINNEVSLTTCTNLTPCSNRFSLLMGPWWDMFVKCFNRLQGFMYCTPYFYRL